MNFLFIGLGSIGQRHLRNLNTISKKNKIYAYRRKFNTPSLNNKNQVIKTDIIKKYKVNLISSLSNLNRFNINAAFICTPSSMHANEIIKIAKQKINIFVEKPICTNNNQIKKIEKILKNTNVKTMVGYQLKFNPIINLLKNKISKKYKNINFVQINHGESVKHFHPYENYKKSYASNKKLGGGVVLTQIHEFDYMRYLFNNFKIKKIISSSSKVSNLNIDVEDTHSSIFKLSNLRKEVICNINLNYYEVPKNRTIKIIFNDGVIVADLNKQEVIENKNNKILKKKFFYSKNDIFVNEIKYFINCIKNNKKIDFKYSILNDLKTIKIALSLKKN